MMTYHHIAFHALLLWSYLSIECYASGITVANDYVSNCSKRCNDVLSPTDKSRIYAPTSREYCYLGCIIRSDIKPASADTDLATNALYLVHGCTERCDIVLTRHYASMMYALNSCHFGCIVGGWYKLTRTCCHPLVYCYIQEEILLHSGIKSYSNRLNKRIHTSNQSIDYMKYHASVFYALVVLSYSFTGCHALGVVDNAEFIERCVERCNDVLNPYNISRIYAPNSRTYCYLGCMIRSNVHPVPTAQIQTNLTMSPEVVRDGNPNHSGTHVDLPSASYPLSATPVPTPVDLHSTAYPFPSQETHPPVRTGRWDVSFTIPAPTPVTRITTAGPPIIPPPTNHNG
jgi:hypothetical protein